MISTLTLPATLSSTYHVGPRVSSLQQAPSATLQHVKRSEQSALICKLGLLHPVLKRPTIVSEGRKADCMQSTGENSIGAYRGTRHKAVMLLHVHRQRGAEVRTPRLECRVVAPPRHIVSLVRVALLLLLLRLLQGPWCLLTVGCVLLPEVHGVTLHWQD